MHKLGMFKADKLTVNMLKAGFFVLFLTQSMAVQAEPDDTQEQKQQTAVETGSDDQQAGNMLPGNYPRWPERQQVRRESTPPPPPGPYMSTALSNNSLRGHHCVGKKNRPARRMDSSARTTDMFSPDRAWPDNLRPAKRWMPADGYHFVSPQVNKKPYPAVKYNMPPSGNYGYRPGSAGGNPYPARPDGYQPDYGSRYNQPVSRNPYPAQSRP